MPRISCDIPAEDFLSRYVKRREPVILVNCTDNWIAQTNWSLDKLLNEKDGKLKWKSQFESPISYLNKFESSDDLSGSLLTKIKDTNGTIRVFDCLGRRMNTFMRRNGTQLETDKMHLFSQYDKPKPIPRDYFEKAGILTDYQWIIISQKDTGKLILGFLEPSDIDFQEQTFTKILNLLLPGIRCFLDINGEIPQSSAIV